MCVQLKNVAEDRLLKIMSKEPTYIHTCKVKQGYRRFFMAMKITSSRSALLEGLLARVVLRSSEPTRVSGLSRVIRVTS